MCSSPTVASNLELIYHPNVNSTCWILSCYFIMDRPFPIGKCNTGAGWPRNRKAGRFYEQSMLYRKKHLMVSYVKYTMYIQRSTFTRNNYISMSDEAAAWLPRHSRKNISRTESYPSLFLNWIKSINFKLIWDYFCNTHIQLFIISM